MRASCLGLLGRTSEASAEVAELLSRKPDFAARGRILLGHYIKFPEVMNPIVDGPGPGGAEARVTAANLIAEEALARLREGNARFVRGEAHFPITLPDIRAALAGEQRPYATILGCSDSRVPPELVFDAGLGDLFVVRLAGNVVSAEVMGTFQYAGTHLATPLFVVLGHEGCGAVRAALDARLRGARERSRIEVLLQSILPGLADIDPGSSPRRSCRPRWRPTYAGPAAAAGDAGGAHARGRGCHEAGRRRLRARDRPRPLPGLKGSRGRRACRVRGRLQKMNHFGPGRWGWCLAVALAAASPARRPAVGSDQGRRCRTARMPRSRP